MTIQVISRSKIFICFFFLIFFTFTNLHSQTFQTGSIIKGSGKYHPQILGEDEERIYVMVYPGKGKKVIEAYSKQNKFSKIYSMDLEHANIDKRYKVTLERVLLFKDQFTILYSYLNPRTRIHFLFAKTFNAANGKATEEKRDILKIELPSSLGLITSGSFKSTISEDVSKIFISYHKSGKNGITKYFMLNNELEVMFEKGADEGLTVPQYYMLDNDGSICYLRHVDKELYVGSYDANRDYEKWEEKVKIEFPKIGVFNITNVAFNVNKKNEFTVTSLIGSTEEGYNRTFGSVYISMDRESKEVKVARINNFSQEFWEQFKSNKDIKKNKDGKIERKFSHEKVIDKQDGGAIMILEQYYNLSSNAGEFIDYGDLVVLNFSPDGEMLWANRIQKRQVFDYTLFAGFVFSTRGFRPLITPKPYKTTRHFSYSTAIFNNKLIVLHNDVLKNVTERTINDKALKFKKPRTAVVVKYEFDLVSGERKKTIFNDWKKTKNYFCPKTFYQKEENSDLILFGIKGSNYSFNIIQNDR